MAGFAGRRVGPLEDPKGDFSELMDDRDFEVLEDVLGARPSLLDLRLKRFRGMDDRSESV